MAGLSQTIGKAAEELACRFLQAQGLTLLTRNWRSRQGEIDLIMLDHDDVVFVEVRARKNDHFGSTLESVDYRKRAALVRASLYFLHQKHWSEGKNCRYDVVGITQGHVEWIKHAFDADQ